MHVLFSGSVLYASVAFAVAVDDGCFFFLYIFFGQNVLRIQNIWQNSNKKKEKPVIVAHCNSYLQFGHCYYLPEWCSMIWPFICLREWKSEVRWWLGGKNNKPKLNHAYKKMWWISCNFMSFSSSKFNAQSHVMNDDDDDDDGQTKLKTTNRTQKTNTHTYTPKKNERNGSYLFYLLKSLD